MAGFFFFSRLPETPRPATLACRATFILVGQARSGCYLENMARDDLFSQFPAEPTHLAGAAETLKGQPLAARLRPRNLSEFVGQSHILGPGQLLRRAIEADRVQSLIFYYPPGTGRTSLAHITD